MNILLLETATSVCSVALACDGAIVSDRCSDQPNAHSSRLAVFVDEIAGQWSLKQLDAVCVSSGPGSYTGLRIGVSYAKGLCYALRIPLLSVPTLQSMAAGWFSAHPTSDALVCPMIDARRMECYTAFYSRPYNEVRPVSADIIEEHIYDRWLDERKVVFVGDGAAKTLPVLSSHPNACFDDTFTMSAAAMLPVAMQKLQEGRVEDVAYFEPFYLKEFVAKKSVIRGLH